MANARLNTLLAQTAVDAPPVVPLAPFSEGLRRTRGNIPTEHRHLTLLQQIEGVRVATGQNHGGADGVTNNTTAVVVVPSPAPGFHRRVEPILVYNVDSATAVILLRKNNGSSERVFHRESLVTKVSTAVSGPIVLSSADSLEILLEGNVSTTQLDWVVSWRDYDSI